MKCYIYTINYYREVTRNILKYLKWVKAAEEKNYNFENIKTTLFFKDWFISNKYGMHMDYTVKFSMWLSLKKSVNYFKK